MISKFTLHVYFVTLSHEVNIVSFIITQVHGHSLLSELFLHLYYYILFIQSYS